MFERISASDHETWMSLRGKDVTASKAAALFGVHPFMTAFQLWALRTGRIKDDPEETPPMIRGRELEPVAVNILRREHPTWEIRYNDGADKLYYRDASARLGATPDTIVMNDQGLGVVQIKSIEQSNFRRQWVTAERDIEPPLAYAVQSLLEAHLVGADWAAVAPLVVGHGIECPVIPIPMKPNLIERLYEETEKFWRIVESGEEMAPEYNRDGETIERMFAADDGSELDLSGNERARFIRRERRIVQDAIKDAEERKKTLDTEMMAILGNHAIGKFADGKRVTWKTTRRKGYTVAPTEFRTIRFPQD